MFSNLGDENNKECSSGGGNKNKHGKNSKHSNDGSHKYIDFLYDDAFLDEYFL